MIRPVAARLQRMVRKSPELRVLQGLPPSIRPPFQERCTLARRTTCPPDEVDRYPSNEERGPLAVGVPALAWAEVGIGVIAFRRVKALSDHVTDIENLGERVRPSSQTWTHARQFPQHRPVCRRVDFQSGARRLLDRDVFQRQVVAVDDHASPSRGTKIQVVGVRRWSVMAHVHIHDIVRAIVPDRAVLRLDLGDRRSGGIADRKFEREGPAQRLSEGGPTVVHTDRPPGRHGRPLSHVVDRKGRAFVPIELIGELPTATASIATARA